MTYIQQPTQTGASPADTADEHHTHSSKSAPLLAVEPAHQDRDRLTSRCQ